MVQVYKFRNFSIYSDSSGDYIVHNRNKEFSSGHTHIRDFKTAKFLIQTAFYKNIPYHLSEYLIDSLIRLSTDKKYIQSVEKLKNKNYKGSRK